MPPNRLATILVICLGIGAEARTIFVDSERPLPFGGDGSSWDQALGSGDSIRNAVDIAEDGDEIWVRGFYPYNGNFEINKPLRIFGGFAGTETTLEQRDWAVNSTHIVQGNPVVYITAHVVLDGFIIRGGFNGDGPAGLQIESASAEIRNCRIYDNVAGGRQSSGVFISSSGIVELENCLIARNIMRSNMGPFIDGSPSGLFVHGDVILKYCTISNNIYDGPTSPGLGSGQVGIFLEGSELKIANSIINGPINQVGGGTTVTINHSNVFGGWPGEGNIDEEPLYLDPTRFQLPDFRLQPNSPGIDAAGVNGPARDLGNRPRPVDIPGVGRDGDDAYDMGAYEFQFSEIPPNPRTDINQDGFRDAQDLLLLLQDWHRVSGPSGN